MLRARQSLLPPLLLPQSHHRLSLPSLLQLALLRGSTVAPRPMGKTGLMKVRSSEEVVVIVYLWSAAAFSSGPLPAEDTATQSGVTVSIAGARFPARPLAVRNAGLKEGKCNQVQQYRRGQGQLP